MIKELTMVKNNYLNNWELKKWDDVLDIRSGRNQKAVLNPNGKYPIIGSAGKVMGYPDDYICEEGTTIIGRKGTINSPLFIEHKFWNVDTAFGLHSKESLDNRFLHYFCLSFDFTELDKGSGRPSLVKSDLLKVQIPIPPLPQQKQIVAILDKAFAVIDTAKANAEQNLQNAKELFESYLQNVFENKGDDWEEKKIEDLSNEKKAIVSGPFGSNLKVADYREEGVPMIRLQNVGKGYFIDKSIKYVDPSKAEELKSHSFKTGDIVLAKLGIPIGKTCIIPEYFGSGIIVADIVRIRPDKKTVNYKFVEYFLNTDLSVSQLNKNISGATRPRVNLSDVRNIIIPIPEIKEQEKIVQKLNDLTTQTKKLEAIYTQKIADLEEMKKSVLQKAFSGNLNPLN